MSTNEPREEKQRERILRVRKVRRIAGAFGIVVGGACARSIAIRVGSLWLAVALAVLVAVIIAFVTALLVGAFSSRSTK